MSEVKRQKNGELATSEIRKLIRAHNVLSAIKIPKGAKRQDIIELLKKKGYMIDHEKAEMRPVTKGKVQKMKVISQKKAKEVLPKPKTDAEKKEAKKMREKKKQEKETEAFKKREAQVKAIGKVVARRKKGEIKQPKNVVPEFENIKQLENYYNESIQNFKKEITKFRNKIKAFDDKKKIQDERKNIRRLATKRILDILDANEGLFEDNEEKYEELETKYENAIDKPISIAAQKRLDEIKK
jgi:hypothetical protein